MAKKRNWKAQNPRRGGPGILFTCERGREGKCRREALQILEYIHERSTASNAKDTKDTPKEDIPSASLEDELNDLRQPTNERPFQRFDTECNGTVMLLCTLPNAARIVPKQEDDADAEQLSKRQKTDSSEPSTSIPATLTTWDPFTTIETVVKEMKDSKTTMPSSRFISRMIPIQATCFTKLSDIEYLVEKLLIDKNEKRTFGIQVKRRLCEIETKDIIATVGNVVGKATSKDKNWTVNLDDPDILIMIEICKTLCGVSVVPRRIRTLARNFNLAELRTETKLQE